MATFIYRLCKTPEIDSSAEVYQNVSPSDVHYDPIRWLIYIKITTGSKNKAGDMLYLPYNPVNRGAMAEFLAKAYAFLMGNSNNTPTPIIYKIAPNSLSRGTKNNSIAFLSQNFGAGKTYNISDSIGGITVGSKNIITTNSIGELGTINFNVSSNTSSVSIKLFYTKLTMIKNV